MERFGAIFIAICMVVIAVSCGAVTHFKFGLTISEAASISFGVLLTLMLIHYQIARVRDRMMIDEQMDDLTRLKLSLTKEVQDVRELATHLEHSVDAKLQGELGPVLSEMEVLGSLIKQLAESCAHLDEQSETQEETIELLRNKLDEATNTVRDVEDLLRANLRKEKEAAATVALAQNAMEMEARPAQARSLVEPSVNEAHASFSDAQEAPNTTGMANHFGLAEEVQKPETIEPSVSPEDEADVRRALALNKLELHMQPVVTLPLRKPKYYEALTRLMKDDGSLITPEIFLPVCRKHNFQAMLDRLAIHEAFKLQRRLAERGRGVDCFCNLSINSLADSDFFAQMRDLFDQNKDLSEHIILELSQADMNQFGVLEDESMQLLRSMGFRFSMDQITSLNTDFDMLARKGVRFAKVAASILTHRDAGRGMDIHPADFSRVLSRKGIELIVTHVETEAVLVNLVDYNIQLAQGNHFAAPKALRQSEPAASGDAGGGAIGNNEQGGASSPAESGRQAQAGARRAEPRPVAQGMASLAQPTDRRVQAEAPAQQSRPSRTLGDNPAMAQALKALASRSGGEGSTQDQFRSVLAQAAGLTVPVSRPVAQSTPPPQSPPQPRATPARRPAVPDGIDDRYPMDRGQFIDLGGSVERQPAVKPSQSTAQAEGEGPQSGQVFERLIR